MSGRINISTNGKTFSITPANIKTTIRARPSKAHTVEITNPPRRTNNSKLIQNGNSNTLAIAITINRSGDNDTLCNVTDIATRHTYTTAKPAAPANIAMPAPSRMRSQSTVRQSASTPSMISPATANHEISRSPITTGTNAAGSAAASGIDANSAPANIGRPVHPLGPGRSSDQRGTNDPQNMPSGISRI